MDQPDDLAPRVAALEAQGQELAELVRHSVQDAAAARVLAGGSDRDVAEMRKEIREFGEQNTRVLNAMREDLTDLQQKVDNGFAEMRGKFDASSAGMLQITELLNALIAQGEQND